MPLPRPARLIAGTCLLLSAAFAAPTPPPGPPGLCSPFEVGGAATTLDAAFKDLAPEKVAETMVRLLDENPAHAAVRMEVMRRAVFAREARPDALDQLALRLTTRALLAKGTDQERAGPVFDAGYFIYQASVLTDGLVDELAKHEDLPGYGLVTRALAMKDDAEMQVGACYVTLPVMHGGDPAHRSPRYPELFRAHAEKAARGSSDPLVVSNLKVALAMEGLQIEQLAAKPQAAPDAKPAR